MNGMANAIVCGSRLNAHLELTVDDHTTAWLNTHASAEMTRAGLARVTSLVRPERLFADLERAGIYVIDEDNAECEDPTGLIYPCVSAWDGGHIALFPRLRGRDGVDDIRGGAGQWNETVQAWIVDMVDAPPIMRHRDIVIYPMAPATVTTADLAQVHPLPGDGTVMSLRGIGLSQICQLEPQKIAGLEAMGYQSAFDVLYNKPRSYIEMSSLVPLGPERINQEVAFVGEVVNTIIPPYNSKRPVEVQFRDLAGNGDVLMNVSFFRNWHVTSTLHPGVHAVLVGKLTSYRGKMQIVEPLVDIVRPEDVFDPQARVVGVYDASAKNDITTWDVRRVAKTASARLPQIFDPIPSALISRRNLMDRTRAIQSLHTPQSLDEAEAARTRLAYEELFRWQLIIAMTRHAAQVHPGWSIDAPGAYRQALLSAKPYPPTQAQERVISEILSDMRQPVPMHRLLQGEVGSGKTLVLSVALAQAVEAGFQACLMVPLDDLASQHYAEIRAELPETIRVELLAKSVSASKRTKLRKAIAQGEVDVVVGTSSLVSEAMTFDRLGLVIIDEQHRFGVEQRRALADKGRASGRTPDVLIVTATPAPRTAQLTTFGDLDVSIIDQMPPGRSPITTQRCDDIPLDTVINHVSQGHQVFVVTPSVKPSKSKTKRLPNVEEVLQTLRSNLPSTISVAEVHGGMATEDRNGVLSRFRQGALDVLVSTTVIEVGVNVPNATLIVITGAEAFGITQLHQLRGRVGRGQWPGECVLITGKQWDELSEDTQRRLTAVVESTNGFDLAQVDLELRGSGNLTGTHQEGRASDLRIAHLMKDLPIVEMAREDARELIESDPQLRAYPMLRSEIEGFIGKDGVKWLETL